MRHKKLRELIQSFPMTPGVYLMRSEAGDILYIGKARSLLLRVRSYFSNAPQLPKIKILMQQVSQIDYVETQTEVDALLLESRLIRKYQPKYNKVLKDDKSYPFLKITHERFPRLHLTRQKKDKKASYFGPFTDAKLLREAINLINTLFPLRKCQKIPKTACLYYHIGQCLAPCIKPDIQTKYHGVLEEVRSFLGGGKRSFIEYLEARMLLAAEELRFEDAQYFKEQIEALSRLRKKRYSLKKGEAAIALSATLQLKKHLKLSAVPEKIICFDVSNIQGNAAVASKVSFYRELPDKMEYRRYKIRSLQGINDYRMIQEALERMLLGIKEGKETFIPDIILIDGGKGHWNAAYEIVKKQGFENTALLSIAKRFEFVYYRPSDKDSLARLPLETESSAAHLLQRIRDEAHRFAITYHRHLRQSRLKYSSLDAIVGVGDKRKKVLLSQFDSLDELKRAGIEQLAGLPGMNRPSAAKIWAHFHSS